MIDGGVGRDPSGGREAYFLEYATQFARELSVPVMLPADSAVAPP